MLNDNASDNTWVLPVLEVLACRNENNVRMAMDTNLVVQKMGAKSKGEPPFLKLSTKKTLHITLI